jgi:DNA-binding transcriptional LysR family regulator
MRMALEGVGIAVINDHFALPYLKRGELVQVLSDWQMPRSPRGPCFRAAA